MVFKLNHHFVFILTQTAKQTEKKFYMAKTKKPLTAVCHKPAKDKKFS